MKKTIFWKLLPLLAVGMMSVGIASCGDDDGDKIPSTPGTTPVEAVVEPVAYVAGESEEVDGYEAVDLGLSVRWATCNVGATQPQEVGGYYAWGELEEKDIYCDTTYATKGKDISRNKSIATMADYDVARNKLEGAWRMPTKAEFDELLQHTTSEWATLNGVRGRSFKAENGNSIFLPITGYKHNESLNMANSSGYYWTATYDDSKSNLEVDPKIYSNCAFCLVLSSNRVFFSSEYRYWGMLIRPVVK